MEKEQASILALLESTNPEDNTIGLILLRKKNNGINSDFYKELDYICWNTTIDVNVYFMSGVEKMSRPLITKYCSRNSAYGYQLYSNLFKDLSEMPL